MGKNEIINRLNHPKASAGLGVFRILFGIIMLWEIIYFYRVDLLDNFIFLPSTLFNYHFLPLTPLSESTMQIMLAGMLISTILITLGLYFRWASVYLFFTLSYILLLDKGLYNNHLYLICLLLLILSFTNADAAFSISKKRQSSIIPAWQYLIIQLHIAMVYFFGGIAKINPYWLNMHPVREILEIRAKNSRLELLTSDFIEYFIMAGGLIFDLCIPFLLWYKKTRKVALVMAVLFNLSNAWIFRDINIFPFFMIAALILFMDQERVLHFTQSINLTAPKNQLKPKMLSSLGAIVLIIYFAIHLYLPFRHFLFPGYVDWTGEGQYFAWRMKIQNREIEEMKFAIFDNNKKEIHQVDPKNFLNLSQYQQLSMHPDMVIQFAEFLKTAASKKMGIQNCMVKSKIKVTFNGSEPQYIFDPDIDLLQVSKNKIPIRDLINPVPPPRNY